MEVHPAGPDTGCVFVRTDVAGAAPIRVLPDALRESALCTTITNADGLSVATIEHLLAALAGCGIHNVRILIDGPEVPILDGSARPFVREFVAAGVQVLDAPLRAIKVTRPVEVRMGEAWARLEPADHLSIAFEIDFDTRAIGRQSLDLELCNGTFVRELSDSRTFCRKAEVDFMRANGLALGGGLHNAVVFDDDGVLNPDGLRHDNEPVRHKMLDAMGDLAVAGAPILGRYIGHRAGHTLTGRLVRALMADPASHEMVVVDARQAHALPGAGVTADDLAPRD